MFKRSRTPALTVEEVAVLDTAVPAWTALDESEHQQFVTAACDLLSRCNWEGSKGFAVTAEMRTVIAGRAALLVAGFVRSPFRSVRTIVVHPTTMQLPGPQPGPIPGTVTAGPSPVLGHTSMTGPVFISWSAVCNDTRDPAAGHDVVVHEFAHRLDFQDGLVDGTPALPKEQRQQWIDVCQAEFDLLRLGHGSVLLRSYAATNPGEFFAVASEVFITQGPELRQDRPALYRVMADFYGQDPAAR